MKIYIGADHRGFAFKEILKAWLEGQGHTVVDCGNLAHDPNDDYPQYAFAVAEAVADDPSSKGLLVCGSGVGMTIAANKVKGIRASLATSAQEVEYARKHDDLNVLALSGDYMSEEDAQNFVLVFLNTSFSSEERYQRRLEQITYFENR